MKTTDDLIASLARQGAATMPFAKQRFVLPLLAVSVLCAAAMLALLGAPFRPTQLHGIGPMVVKWGFSLPLVTGAVLALYGLGRPGRTERGPLTFVWVPFLAVAVLLAIDIADPSGSFPGQTWRQCLLAMGAMSPLAFAGAIIAARWLAPTQLRRAGMAAGLFGGGVAMSAYAPFCPELGMIYMAVFYCLPILVMAAIGWLLGPRLLRW
ncbi:hypothetical protein GCM10009127_17990 [Alteraurantiacibacter aestuarii]|uniref:DUF1109 domain-containing protein n=1 Tax=Alteraurantiacibacter aestuarii TaxID=650004 RepID=UPI0031E41BAC